ncbi:MAG: o-succinylbenzoate synthase [Gemmatimonadota bacterium]
MRPHRIEIREIRLPLREVFEISSGSRQNRRIILVQVEGEGAAGWGECVAAEDPGYSYETTETAWHVLSEFLLPALVGHEMDGPEDILAPVAWVRGHRMAKAAIEMAVWDLHARLLGMPLWELLGGVGNPVEVGVSVGLQRDQDSLLRKVEGYLSEGYARIKLKIKPGRDVEMLRAVRERFPEATLMADANSAYTLADQSRLKLLDELDLLMIEQPLGHEDLLDHARLQENLETPICLDESIRSVEDARLALKLGSGRIINIKPGRVGGHAEARRLQGLAREAGVPAWCGGMLESGIGRGHNLSLATLPGFTLPGDISGSSRYWERDIVSPPFEVGEDGRMPLRDGAGIGVEPDPEILESLTVRTRVFEG